MNKPILKVAATNAVLTSLYITGVSFFMFNAQNFLPKEDNFLMSVLFLSLFVFSAAVTGSLVFGRPILWYMDGKKREAIELLAHTLGIFFLITIALAVVVIIKQ